MSLSIERVGIGGLATRWRDQGLPKDFTYEFDRDLLIVQEIGTLKDDAERALSNLLSAKKVSISRLWRRLR